MPFQNQSLSVLPVTVAFFLTSFCLGELGDGLSIFQGIYLVGLGWNEGSVGIALGFMSFTCLIIQPWAGDWLDRTSIDRRLILVAVSLVTAVTACSVLLVPPGNKNHLLVFVSKMIDGISAAFFEPCLAALTLACFGPNHFDSIMASNLLFAHLGAVVVAIAAGFVSYFVYPHVKYCFLVLCFAALASFFFIQFLPEGDHDMGRGFAGKVALDEDNHLEKTMGPEEWQEVEKARSCDGSNEAAKYWDVLSDKRTVLVSLSGFFFHFANANVLLVLGELMGGDMSSGVPKRTSIPMIASAVVIAQSVMVGATYAADVLTQRGVGRKPLFMVGLLSLPIRCALILLLKDAGIFFLLTTEILDGIGFGLICVVHPFLVADITFGSGRFNLLMGFTSATFGLGATLSNLLGQWSAQILGYETSLCASLIISFIPLFTFSFMPETLGGRSSTNDFIHLAEKEIEAPYRSFT